MIIKGKNDAIKIYKQIEPKLKQDSNPLSLAIIRTTTSSNQIKYTELKKRQASKLGIKAEIFSLMENPTNASVIKTITELSEFTGILVQLPLAENLDKYSILNAIPYHQDVEGLSKARMGELLQGIPDIYPPATQAVIRILNNAEKENLIKVKGSRATVIGNSYFTGMSVSLALGHLGCTVTSCDLYTPDISEYTKKSDIIISCTGKRHIIKPEMIKDNCAIIDIGFDQDENGKVYGDTDPKVEEKASLYTPVPGGIGPITVANIFQNLLKLKQN